MSNGFVVFVCPQQLAQVIDAVLPAYAQLGSWSGPSCILMDVRAATTELEVFTDLDVIYRSRLVFLLRYRA